MSLHESHANWNHYRASESGGSTSSKGRVGIITLPGCFNYGNRLQLFATGRVYARFGYSVEALSVRRFNPLYKRCGVREKLTDAAKMLLRRSDAGDPQSMSSPARIAAFRKFSSKVSERVVEDAESVKCEEYSLFSCGSDQVWNPESLSCGGNRGVDLLIHKLMDPIRAHRMFEWYFLGFCPREKRIALAPSIGLDSLSGERARLVGQGVQNFERLSVRETRGAELIKSITGRDAEIICDPTIVLDAEEWRSIASDALTPSSPYVFTYLLGGVGEDASIILDKVTGAGSLPVIPLSDRQKTGELDAGPAEFISLIDNAVHVVTDSFHAAVFSSIMQTPLTIVRREGGTSMFSRLETLAQTLGIEHKIYGSPDFDLSRAGDYRGVSEAIESERKKFMGYLEGCLDAQLPGWRDDVRA